MLKKKVNNLKSFISYCLNIKKCFSAVVSMKGWANLSFKVPYKILITRKRSSFADLTIPINFIYPIILFFNTPLFWGVLSIVEVCAYKITCISVYLLYWHMIVKELNIIPTKISSYYLPLGFTMSGIHSVTLSLFFNICKNTSFIVEFSVWTTLANFLS